MFGSRREVRVLNAEVAALRKRLRALDTEVAVLRPLRAEAGRIDELAERATQLSEAAKVAMAAVDDRAVDAGLARPRVPCSLNTVYRADVLGYISLYYRGGRTGHVRLLVGE